MKVVYFLMYCKYSSKCLNDYFSRCRIDYEMEPSSTVLFSIIIGVLCWMLVFCTLYCMMCTPHCMMSSQVETIDHPVPHIEIDEASTRPRSVSVADPEDLRGLLAVKFIHRRNDKIVDQLSFANGQIKMNNQVYDDKGNFR